MPAAESTSTTNPSEAGASGAALIRIIGDDFRVSLPISEASVPAEVVTSKWPPSSVVEIVSVGWLSAAIVPASGMLWGTMRCSSSTPLRALGSPVCTSVELHAAATGGALKCETSRGTT
eukprot:4029599-Pyramimonas_sp.AAC.1